ncbi:MAG: amidophosphoribosyltransferase [Ferruginibacter sp.]|nr:amidophosphoribosyltransferase [Ferruginibacter sp.]
MSDQIKHECGLAFIRLRKSFSYYQQKYHSALYGLNKLYLLMEKQHNRGQDGAGVASLKLNTEPGYPFLYRIRSNASQPIADVFDKIGKEIKEVELHQPDIKSHPGLMKGHINVMGEILLGHLRYGTQGKNDINFCHPFIKKNIITARNLALAGNFNLVNTEELFEKINVAPGPFQIQSDLAAMMEILYHFLVDADEKTPGNPEISEVLKKAVPMFDGGFHFAGMTGNGDAFIVRDAHGIRPSYYFINDDVIVAASERAAIRTAFNLEENEVQELMPGAALIIKANGNYSIEQIVPARERRACSFERIYFSRGSDEKIYRERIALGYKLSNVILKSIDYDLKNTIFSFIPNTAETAFYGLVKGAEDYLNNIKIDRILSWKKEYDEEQLREMITRKIRVEKIAIKDVKLRPFFTKDGSRNEIVQPVYDITYGTVRKNTDTLVVIDDSIVRGTTLKQSIIKMLGRLSPKRIIIVSSAPQIRYPDCYGIDMSKLGDFVAFRAAIELLRENGKESILKELIEACKTLKANHQLHTENLVKRIYKPFTVDQISKKIAELITPEDYRIPIDVIFQSIEDLHDACPNNKGDWYFTGNYPTPGGNRVCNNALLNYLEGKNIRGY